MGFIINDSLTLSNGLVVTGAYASLMAQPIVIEKELPYLAGATGTNLSWTVTARYNLWVNKDTAGKSLPYIEQKVVKTDIDPAKQSVFPVLYAAMKAQYKSTTDC